MSLADSPIGKPPIAAHEQATAAAPRPRNRTSTAQADIVSDPEPR